jgi:hypothetical protein
MNCSNAAVQRVAVFAMLLLSLVEPKLGRAQSPDRRAPVTIAVVDTFTYHNADVVIVRRAVTMPHDVIVVKRDKLRPSWLAEAIVALRAVRQQAGEIPETDMLVRVPPPTRIHRYQHMAEGWAHTLQLTPQSQLDGIGRASVLTVDVP